jgi:hypothetical protein
MQPPMCRDAQFAASGSLGEWNRRDAARHGRRRNTMTNATHLHRVFHSIAGLVEAFACHRWETHNREFVIAELHEFVRANSEIAPASPDRILRELRLKGRIGYEVVNRRESRYRLTVAPASVAKQQAELF